MNLAQSDCPFCAIDPDRLLLEGQLAFAIWDQYPVSSGHALIIPKRHIGSWFDATVAEQLELFELLRSTRQEVEKTRNPGGYNIGVNIGIDAGQTVPHLHVHLIPRYQNDVENPRGGVRHVIPHLADYLAQEAEEAAPAAADQLAWEKTSPFLRDLPHERPLIIGGEDPLLPHLRTQIDAAEAVDFSIAFVLESGLRLIEPHLVDLLDRDGRLRLVTGDYLGVTEPRALKRLIDLEERFPGQTDLRAFEAGRGTFHPKSFIFHLPNNQGLVLVGSSNLTGPALLDGIEWNLRTITATGRAEFAEVSDQFERLLTAPHTVPLTHDWVETYEQRRNALRIVPARDIAPPEEAPEPPPMPHVIQELALEKLRQTREKGNKAGLVVMATGLGKTWLSAFDVDQMNAKRVLFVAHREEILGQAMETFRRTRPSAHLGLYTGMEKDRDADVLFASVQTLSRKFHLEQFAPTKFDYVVIDEFHHASARTYRKIIDYFEPRFLLGLTATPERTDGGDLLSLCQGNLVYRCDLRDGIYASLLSPFHYFGVPDEVDYSNIPWRSSRFDEEALTNAVATQSRASNALEQYRKRGGTKALGFCCSQRHANFMRSFFQEHGIRAAAVHSGQGSDPRAASLEKLAAGQLDIVFAVDMFNEGVDVPDIDTVMMLRPTESRILWLQQLGRGLRKADDKDHLRVIDYIGNHRTFLLKPQTLFELPPGDMAIERLLSQLQSREVDLPPGCEVTYELEAIDILRGLLRSHQGTDAFRFFYEDFKDRNGRRPSASEMFHERYSLRSVRPGYGSWFGFVRDMGDLTEGETAVLNDGSAERFLNELERTRMTRSFKMLVLLAMQDRGQLPGRLSGNELVQEIQKFVSRSSILRSDFSVALDDPAALKRYLEKNPIDAWLGGNGPNQTGFFRYENEVFETTFGIDPDISGDFSEMARELVDFRLTEYLEHRAVSDTQEAGDGLVIAKIIHSNGRPIIMLPDRERTPGLPEGWNTVTCDGNEYEVNFAKIAINVARRPGGSENILAQILRGWFGENVGAPGTAFQVQLSPASEIWEIKPLQGTTNAGNVEVGKSYMRAEIPPLFGLEFREAVWNQGYVLQEDQVFLLVSLEKEGMVQEHQYADRFLSPGLFEWVSQNRHRRDSKPGQMMRDHEQNGISVHLFVRKDRKIKGKAAPFIYCGDVAFEDWDGDAPIKIRWRLKSPLPDRTAEFFKAV